jgi:uncharacterized membrane protein YphA (DoxX/SURF4 family)
MIRIICYWIATCIIVLETAVGSWWDLARIPFVCEVLHRLGYPLYLLSIIGVWKVLAVPALLAPGFARIKEWAYAGIFFIYTTAAVSHWSVGDVSGVWGPLIFAGLVVASWALRPPSRRMAPDFAIQGDGQEKKKWEVIGYRTTIVLLAFVLLSGGAAEIIHYAANVEGIVHRLGYPLYFLSIQGAWKILGGIVLLLPGLALLKEWAYAGVIFNMTGAVASSLICGHGIGSVIAPLIITGIAFLSWAWRPSKRVAFRFAG